MTAAGPENNGQPSRAVVGVAELRLFLLHHVALAGSLTGRSWIVSRTTRASQDKAAAPASSSVDQDIEPWLVLRPGRTISCSGPNLSFSLTASFETSTLSTSSLTSSCCSSRAATCHSLSKSLSACLTASYSARTRCCLSSPSSSCFSRSCTCLFLSSNLEFCSLNCSSSTSPLSSRSAHLVKVLAISSSSSTRRPCSSWLGTSSTFSILSASSSAIFWMSPSWDSCLTRLTTKSSSTGADLLRPGQALIPSTFSLPLHW